MKAYLCLHQTIAEFTWMWFFKKCLLVPMVRLDSTRRWTPIRAIGLRSSFSLVKSYVRALKVLRGYEREGGSNEGVLALPCYGQACLPVHQGYKVFDWYKKTVTKVFDAGVESSRILEEVERLRHIAQFDFSPSIKKWNLEERWYEEDLLTGSLDSSYTPMDSNTVLTRFQDTVVHQLTSLIHFQEPATVKAVTYVADMIQTIRGSRIFKQESAEQVYRRLDEFIEFILCRLQQEGECPICLVFTHGDFVPANMLNTRDGLKIIDWEGAGYRSALFDFYSYFSYRSASRNIPVRTLMSEIQKAMPLFIAELAKNAREVALSIRGAERVYRWTFYIEMLSRLVEREMSDRNLNVMNYILKYIEVFNECEEMINEQ